jgi:hypothetical protein
MLGKQLALKPAHCAQAGTSWLRRELRLRHGATGARKHPAN